MPVTKRCLPFTVSPSLYLSARFAGRYAIEANKPKVFVDAVKMIRHPAVGRPRLLKSARLISRPNQRTAKPCARRSPLKASLSGFGAIEPGSVQMRVSGLGVVPASYDPKPERFHIRSDAKIAPKTRAR